MAIEFIVEDGTGLSTATAYISLAEFRQYWENRGVDYSSKADTVLQAAINKATQAIDNSYLFDGIKDQTTQALKFPRIGIYDEDNNDVSGLPSRVKYACAEFAKYDIDGRDLQPVVEYIQSRRIGPVSINYTGGKQIPPIVQKAESYIGVFVRGVGVAR